MDGSHWQTDICNLGGGKWRLIIKCQESPEYNSIDVMEEGKENTVDSPIYGGKAKVNFCSPDERTFNVVAKTEQFGTWTWNETYSDQGISITVKAGNNTNTENWCRSVNEEGFFRCIDNEGAYEYIKAQGEGWETALADAEASLRYISLGGDSWYFVETMNGATNTFKVKMDEEFDYSIPGWKRKAVATRYIYSTTI